MAEPHLEKPLSGTFRNSLTDLEKKCIIEQFWPHDPPYRPTVGYLRYFRYYEETCESVYDIGSVPPEQMVANTHKHILQIVEAIYEILRSEKPCTRPEVRRHLQTEKYFGKQPAEKLNHSINLALKLWVLINIQERRNARGFFATWDDNSTLRTFIEQQFPGPRGEIELADGTHTITDKERSIVLESNFTAANLERIAGIKIEWTYNMLEHLSFNRHKRQLWVFPLKQYLHNQQDVHPEVIPSCITRELIQSLQLLFPTGDLRTQKMFFRPATSSFSSAVTDHLPFTNKRELQTFISEQPMLDRTRTYLCEFYHFRDRIAEIAYEFSSPPPKIKQVWTDRRNALQYWTFWFAFAIFCFTIIFGVVSIVLAGLQTRYSYEMLVMARDAANTTNTYLPANCAVVCTSGENITFLNGSIQF